MGTSRLTTVPLAKRYRAPGAPFARKYTPGDVRLLVEMDKAHEDVCGPAVVHLLKRAYTLSDDVRYERLVDLSSSHLYNLRKSGAGAELALLPQRLVGQDVLSGNLQRLFRQ